MYNGILVNGARRIALPIIFIMIVALHILDAAEHSLGVLRSLRVRLFARKENFLYSALN